MLKNRTADPRAWQKNRFVESIGNKKTK